MVTGRPAKRKRGCLSGRNLRLCGQGDVDTGTDRLPGTFTDCGFRRQCVIPHFPVNKPGPPLPHTAHRKRSRDSLTAVSFGLPLAPCSL